MATTETAVFGGGCFWCTEAVFQQLNGVVSAEPGYAGGTVPNPTYEQVSTGTTGHVEVAKIEFDPAHISYHDLLTVFFATHDPTTLNRQGNDIGPQYRSIVFFTTPQQKIEAEAFIAELNTSTAEGSPIVTTVEPFTKVWPAEDYHRQYYEHHTNERYCQLIIAPKIRKVQERFAKLLREQP